MMVCANLVRILAETNAPDDERRVVLEKFLAMLRTDDPRRVQYEGWFLILDIGDKYDVHMFEPWFEEELRRMRSERQSQMVIP